MALPGTLHWGQFCHQKTLASSIGNFGYHRSGKRSGTLLSILQSHGTVPSIKNVLTPSMDHAWDTVTPGQQEKKRSSRKDVSCLIYDLLRILPPIHCGYEFELILELDCFRRHLCISSVHRIKEKNDGQSSRLLISRQIKHIKTWVFPTGQFQKRASH